MSNIPLEVKTQPCRTVQLRIQLHLQYQTIVLNIPGTSGASQNHTKKLSKTKIKSYSRQFSLKILGSSS